MGGLFRYAPLRRLSNGSRIEEVLLRREDQVRLVVVNGLRRARRQQVVRNRCPDLVDVARPKGGKLYSVDALAHLPRNA